MHMVSVNRNRSDDIYNTIRLQSLTINCKLNVDKIKVRVSHLQRSEIYKHITNLGSEHLRLQNVKNTPKTTTYMYTHD